ncbi:hypothetical protein D3C75_1119900 [compost metagenome]
MKIRCTTSFPARIGGLVRMQLKVSPATAAKASLSRIRTFPIPFNAAFSLASSRARLFTSNMVTIPGSASAAADNPMGP